MPRDNSDFRTPIDSRRKNGVFNSMHDPDNAGDQQSSKNQIKIDIPTISLPKGGGALKSIDEKFKVNNSNGTSSISIPFPLTPNRGSLTPRLSLSYNSGVGNSIFGIGWELSLGRIERSTNKKLPRYYDSDKADETELEDTFLFIGAEDLVPYMNFNNGNWTLKQFEDANGNTVRQYRPRIEGSFLQIERIHQKHKGYYWKVTTKENVTTFLGVSENCRITDPTDKSKIFSWLPELTFDDKGSCIWYQYKDEDIKSVEHSVHENNRFNGNGPFSNKFLKSVKYGNAIPYYVDPNLPFEPKLPGTSTFHFEFIFDYGEHDTDHPKPQDNTDWKARIDAFSNYRAGFDMRTYRLCKRVLMYHSFPSLNSGIATLVKSLDFSYQSSDPEQQDRPVEVTYLTTITQKGYILTPNGNYSSRSLPPITFDYQKLKWNTTINFARAENMPGFTGIDGNSQWVDLYSEGVNGLLSEFKDAWYYRSFSGVDNKGDVHFTPAQQILTKPSFSGLRKGELLLQDLEASGEKQIVVTSPGMQGFFELNDDAKWEPFKSFAKALHLDLSNPNVKIIDLNGDGRSEILFCDHGAFTWWASEGKEGYADSEKATRVYDEEKGPQIIFTDNTERIFLADMTGDGLTDIARISNGEICYWPNLGYGRFGAKVKMMNSPNFDHPDQFHPSFLHLADISGTGLMDVIYLGQSKLTAYLNLSGNAWSAPTEIDPFFPTEHPNRISVTDLLGNGTSCIVWSSELPEYSEQPLRYIDLMDGKKPHLMKSFENGMGKKIEIEYKSSTQYYLDDKRAGKHWITKLPFPVHCVAKVVTTERVRNTRFVTGYSYHHGYYDHTEREFRGFGRVDQTDTEFFETAQRESGTIIAKELHQAPVLTRSWYDNGAYFNKGKIADQIKLESWHQNFRERGYTDNFIEYSLPEPGISIAASLEGLKTDKLSAEEIHESARACKGMLVRQEIFGIDTVDPSDSTQLKRELTPYSVSVHTCRINVVQQKLKNKFAVFLVNKCEEVTYDYERDASDPRISHQMNLATDELGNTLESVFIAYPRTKNEEILQDNASDNTAIVKAKANGRQRQGKFWITFTKNEFTDDKITNSVHRLRQPSEVSTYELTGLKVTNELFKFKDLVNIFNTLEEIQYHETPDELKKQKRLTGRTRTKYYNEDLSGHLAINFQASHGLPYASYQLTYTIPLINELYTPSAFSSSFIVDSNDMIEAKFHEEDQGWWMSSGNTEYRKAGDNMNDVKNRFFHPVLYTDPMQVKTQVIYDPGFFFIEKTIDAAGNEVAITSFDHRTLTPYRVKDENHNFSSVLTDELGIVKVIAVEGKDLNNDQAGDEVDSINGHTEYTSSSEQILINSFFQAALTDTICNYSQLNSIARSLLKNASTRIVHDLKSIPAVSARIVREEHTTINPNSKLCISFEFSDGMGEVVMTKLQAKQGFAKSAKQLADGTWEIEEVDTGFNLRWIGSGRTVVNNKGLAIKQYEPYYSISPKYEDATGLVEHGVTSILYYDPAGRVIKKEMPNGTFSRTEFHGWKRFDHDANDTVTDSSWYNSRMALAGNPVEKRTAQKTKVHEKTPSCIILDTLGRIILGIDHNKYADATNSIKEELIYTYTELDVRGNALYITDGRGNTVMSCKFNMAGHAVLQSSMDKGKRWMLNNASGQPMKMWDERQHEFYMQYDIAGRLISKFIKGGDGVQSPDHLYEKIIYGEDEPNAIQNNLRGKISKIYDGGGKVVLSAYDVKGNLLSSIRTFAKNYKLAPDWKVDPDSLLETANYNFSTSHEYDALNRVIKETRPDLSVTIPTYDPSGLPEKIELDNNQIITSYIKSISYNARGQRTEILYGNDVKIKFSYDPYTFRLTSVKSARINGEVLQDISYTYDPMGNICFTEDKAIPTIFFNNQKISGTNEYSYDALYRLISAEGREQNTNAPNFPDTDNWNDSFAIFHHTSGDAMAMRNYKQVYRYDVAGNILQMRHEAGANGSWTRDYDYANKNNRLQLSNIGTQQFTYLYHEQHGFMTGVPHIEQLKWSFHDRLDSSARQRRTDGGIAETTYYLYDQNGQRIRKVTENAASPGSIPTKKDERIYIGNYEVYRNANGLERETIHIKDNVSRIAMIDTITSPGISPDPNASVKTTRYQLNAGNGSVSMELDENAIVINYEEFHPFGTTAYLAKNEDIQVASKRYRYTAMERDEETGLEYHGARYYLPWLGRWLSADPAELKGGMNFYSYTRNNPVRYVDIDGKQEQSPPAEQPEISHAGIILDIAGDILKYEFTKTMQQTPEEFFGGIKEKVESLTVKPVKTIFWPGGMADKAASKFVDEYVFDQPEKDYVTPEEHKQQLEAIKQIGGTLFPGFGPVGTGTRGAGGTFVMSPGGTLTLAPELVLSPGVTQAPGLIIAASAADPKKAGGAAKKEKAPEKKTPEPEAPDSKISPTPSEELTASLVNPNALTHWANKVKGLGQMEGATVEIVQATKNGETFFVAGINSSAKGFNQAQLAELKRLGIRVAPQELKYMKNAPHAEENMAVYLDNIGARGQRWSKGVVGNKPGYVCGNCQSMIKRVGGVIEE